MVSTLLHDLQNGHRIIEAKHHHDNRSLYVVHALNPKKDHTKSFPSVGTPLLLEALQSAGQLDDAGRIITTLPLQPILENGWKVSEFQYFESIKDYSCTISKDDCVDMWLPSVSEQEMATALEVSVEILGTSHPQHLKFQDVSAREGMKVVAFKHHKLDERYSCTILLPATDPSSTPTLKTFANVTSGHLIEALENSYPEFEGVSLYIQHDHWVSNEKGSLEALLKHKPKGLTFEHALKEFGGKIVKKHSTQIPDRYAVEVETMDGLIHHFAGVSAEHLQAFAQ